MYISSEHYTIPSNGKDQSNLIALIKWNPEKHFLCVKEGKLEFRTLPVGNVTLDKDTVCAVTTLVTETLTKLWDVTLRAKGQLTHSSPQTHISMADCADTIKIFVKFWKDTQLNLDKVLATANDEYKGRTGLSSLFGNRKDIDALQEIRDRVLNSKERPIEFSFEPHVGRNTSGLIISETTIKDNSANAPKKLYYRIEGGAYGAVSSYNYQRSRRCGTALLAFEVHEGNYVPHHTETKISWFKNGPTVSVVNFPTTCSDRTESHDCPVTKAHDIFVQLMDELKPGDVFVRKEWNDSEKVLARLQTINNGGRHLKREHAFFTELAKP